MIKIAKMPAFGAAGPHVVTYQEALLAKGFKLPLYGADGGFGTETRAATSKFQKKIGLAGSGKPGPATLKALGLVVDAKGAPPATEPITGLPSIKVKSPRTLPDALEVMIDNAVDLKAARKAIQGRNAAELIVLTCKALNSMEIREKTNKNDGTVVELVQKVAGGKRGYAWCMYAVQVAIAWAERKLGKVSKLPATGSCASMRSRTPKSHQIRPEDSLPGDVWIWIYTSSTGHTGIFVGWKGKLKVAYLYEGNTTKGLGKDGKIEREGGGYYLTERAFKIEGMRLGMVCRAFHDEELLQAA